MQWPEVIGDQWPVKTCPHDVVSLTTDHRSFQ